jgi:hypothetical protein
MAQIGVKGAKIEEVLSVEGDSLASLPYVNPLPSPRFGAPP